ncbi:hypothetical protein [Tateyamaria omphalii]|uniref:Uncharacterized protein n=1 Tax=Tateyamaria omphalii TaxID=299262 RepID=A0A1P8MQG6_9RHOB|nr:hypothetical protein [Tateyamaria omphalii]APX10308.1 hypothetical protein BWR18_00270 [Tateyamaria omphalii]
MSEPNQLFAYCMIGMIIVLVVLREVAASCLPASHWLNQILHRDNGSSGGGGDGGFWDCDGGDGGD